jgi:hypothetical protein
MKLKAVLIIFFVSLSLIPGSQAQEQSVSRGPDYIITREGNEYVFESAPKWIFDNGAYQPYVYQNLTDYYVLKNGVVALELYDTYARYYNLDLSEVRLYEEYFELEIWRSQGRGSWDQIGAYSGEPNYYLIQDTNFFALTQSFDSWAGQFNITYNILEGTPAKIDLSWRSLIAENTTYRYLQAHSGIVAEQVEYFHNNTREMGRIPINQAQIINASTLRYLDGEGSLVFGAEQISGIEYLQPIELDIQANGLKANYYYSNFTLGFNETFKLDPENYTDDQPIIDLSPCWEQNTDAYFKENFTALYAWRYSSSNCDGPPNEPTRRRIVIQWNISAIPDGSTITNVTFNYEGVTNSGTNPRSIFELITDPRITEAETLFNTSSEGNVYLANSTTWPIVAVNQSQTLGAQAVSDLEDNLPIDWFGIKIRSTEEVLDAGGIIWAQEKGGPDTPPTLRVIYTIPEFVYITGIWFTGIESLNANSTIILVNNTQRQFNNNTEAEFIPNLSDNYQFGRYQLENGSHIHFSTYTTTLSANYTISAYALQAGGEGVNNDILMGILVVFIVELMLLALVLSKN